MKIVYNHIRKILFVSERENGKPDKDFTNISKIKRILNWINRE